MMFSTISEGKWKKNCIPNMSRSKKLGDALNTDSSRTRSHRWSIHSAQCEGHFVIISVWIFELWVKLSFNRSLWPLTRWTVISSSLESRWMFSAIFEDVFSQGARSTCHTYFFGASQNFHLDRYLHVSHHRRLSVMISFQNCIGNIVWNLY